MYIHIYTYIYVYIYIYAYIYILAITWCNVFVVIYLFNRTLGQWLSPTFRYNTTQFYKETSL